MAIQSSVSARADTSSNAADLKGTSALEQSSPSAQGRRLQPRRYRPGPAPLTDLPFVGHVKIAPRRTRISFWNVPSTDNYGKACDMGRQYACDMMQYLKDNPCIVGANSLGLLVREMASVPDDASSGYAVGFWSMVEAFLYRYAMAEDHWAVAQQFQDRDNAILAARLREVAAPEHQSEQEGVSQ